MAEQSENYKHDSHKHHDEESLWGYTFKHEDESSPDPMGTHGGYDDDESSIAYSKPGYVPYGMPKGMPKPMPKPMKKKKKIYYAGYYSQQHTSATQTHWKSQCPPIVCDPQYVVRDCYIPREVPVIHPVVNVNRHVIVNVPKHYSQSMTKNVVVDPGCPGSSCHHHGYPG